MTTRRTHRPVERFWPYVEKPEEPTVEELAALDPELHETRNWLSKQGYGVKAELARWIGANLT